ncbi:hypothetical protein BZG36_01151 [Bifiguratus adelaidae]|uniref:B30.2/SPRY domain-containing protein n=1 Tax=Bifiguratus adelaidae TaxID=1938954 RepID=A0A261Y5V4_9FUNG|nr:hypothetical protein BZG36_01151 [Bifiguratus adelaidae]
MNVSEPVVYFTSGVLAAFALYSLASHYKTLEARRPTERDRLIKLHREAEKGESLKYEDLEVLTKSLSYSVRTTAEKIIFDRGASPEHLKAIIHAVKNPKYQKQVIHILWTLSQADSDRYQSAMCNAGALKILIDSLDVDLEKMQESNFLAAMLTIDNCLSGQASDERRNMAVKYGILEKMKRVLASEVEIKLNIRYSCLVALYNLCSSEDTHQAIIEQGYIPILLKYAKLTSFSMPRYCAQCYFILLEILEHVEPVQAKKIRNELVDLDVMTLIEGCLRSVRNIRDLDKILHKLLNLDDILIRVALRNIRHIASYSDDAYRKEMLKWGLMKKIMKCTASMDEDVGRISVYCVHEFVEMQTAHKDIVEAPEYESLLKLGSSTRIDVARYIVDIISWLSYNNANSPAMSKHAKATVDLLRIYMASKDSETRYHAATILYNLSVFSDEFEKLVKEETYDMFLSAALHDQDHRIRVNASSLMAVYCFKDDSLTPNVGLKVLIPNAKKIFLLSNKWINHLKRQLTDSEGNDEGAVSQNEKKLDDQDQPTASTSISNTEAGATTVEQDEARYIGGIDDPEDQIQFKLSHLPLDVDPRGKRAQQVAVLLFHNLRVVRDLLENENLFTFAFPDRIRFDRKYVSADFVQDFPDAMERFEGAFDTDQHPCSQLPQYLCSLAASPFMSIMCTKDRETEGSHLLYRPILPTTTSFDTIAADLKIPDQPPGKATAKSISLDEWFAHSRSVIARTSLRALAVLLRRKPALVPPEMEFLRFTVYLMLKAPVTKDAAMLCLMYGFREDEYRKLARREKIELIRILWLTVLRHTDFSDPRTVFYAEQVLTKIAMIDDTGACAQQGSETPYASFKQVGKSILDISLDELGLANVGNYFESAMATRGIRRDDNGPKYRRICYEIILRTNGLIQAGWANDKACFRPEGGVGVGDDDYSYSYDGYRSKRWHGKYNQETTEYGQKWSINDIVTACLDLEEGTIRFYKNQEDLGVAFTNVSVDADWRPACTIGAYQACDTPVNITTSDSFIPENYVPYALCVDESSRLDFDWSPSKADAGSSLPETPAAASGRLLQQSNELLHEIGAMDMFFEIVAEPANPEREMAIGYHDPGKFIHIEVIIHCLKGTCQLRWQREGLKEEIDLELELRRHDTIGVGLKARETGSALLVSLNGQATALFEVQDPEVPFIPLVHNLARKHIIFASQGKNNVHYARGEAMDAFLNARI